MGKRQGRLLVERVEPTGVAVAVAKAFRRPRVPQAIETRKLVRRGQVFATGRNRVAPSQSVATPSQAVAPSQKDRK